MKNEAIALWHKLIEKQTREAKELAELHEKQKKAFGSLMQFTCDLDCASGVDDLVRASESSFEALREGLSSIVGSMPTYNPRVQFENGAKPYTE